MENYLSAEDNMRIIDRVGSPAVKVYYDVGNSTDKGRDILKEIRTLGKLICELHAKDGDYDARPGPDRLQASPQGSGRHRLQRLDSARSGRAARRNRRLCRKLPVHERHLPQSHLASTPCDGVLKHPTREKMMKTDGTRQNDRASSRGEFLKRSTAAAAGATLAANLSIARSAHANGSDTIKIALVGCGGRGTGAAVNALRTKTTVKLVAMADAFSDRVASSVKAIQTQCPDRVDVPEERRFAGLDAYRMAIESGVDVVLICGPPGFRPAKFEAAVQAGKHVFMEKPLATDTVGVRRVMAANQQAKQKKLAVAVGPPSARNKTPRSRQAYSRRRDRRFDVPAGVL